MVSIVIKSAAIIATILSVMFFGSFVLAEIHIDTNGRVKAPLSRYFYNREPPGNIRKCKQRREMLEEVERGGLARKIKRSKQSAELKNARLYIWAESHINHLQTYYPFLFAELLKRDERINCLFIEFTDDREEQIIEALKIGDEVGPEKMGIKPYWKLIRKAHLEGVKVIPVDAPLSLVSDRKAVTLKGYDQRDKYMVEKMIDSFNRNDEGEEVCEKGLIVVGREHISSRFHKGINKRTTIVDLLNTYNDEVERESDQVSYSRSLMINPFLDLGTKMRPPRLGSIWHWHSCENPTFPKEAFGFSIDDLNADQRKLPTVVSGTGRWEDFDDVYVLPKKPEKQIESYFTGDRDE